MSDVTVSVTESTTAVTVSQQSVAVAITETPTTISTSTVGLQGISGATGATGATGPTGPSGVISVTAPITNTGTSSSAILGLDQTGLSILKSQVSDFTSGTVAVATNASTATYSTTSGTASYATTSGTAVYATNSATAVNVSGSAITRSQISNFASGTVASATSATSANTALTAGTASYATTSLYATTSGTADYAKSAGSALYSTSSGSALNAGTAVTISGSITKSQVSDFTSGTVAVATNASTATYSTTSGTATYATLSGTAVSISGTITKSQVSDFTSGTVTTISGSITKSQVSDFTSGTVASATVAGTATYATTSGTASYSTTSGTAVSISGSIIKSQVSDFTSGTVANISGTVAATQVTGTAIVVGSSALVPTGGTAGQVLSKVDSTNYNLTWSTPSSGGGSGFTGVGTAVTSLDGRTVSGTGAVSALSLVIEAGNTTTTSASDNIVGAKLYLQGGSAVAVNTAGATALGGDVIITGGSVNAPNASNPLFGNAYLGTSTTFNTFIGADLNTGGKVAIGTAGEVVQIGAASGNPITLNAPITAYVNSTSYTMNLGTSGGTGQTFTGRIGYNNTGTAVLQIGSQNGGAQITIGGTAVSWTNLQGVTFMPATINAISTTGTAVYTALTGGIITSTPGSAITITLPTGNAITTGITGAPSGVGFDWSLINLSGSFAATLGTAANHTITGGSVIAAATSGRFRSKYTGSNIWVTYRIS
jgi:hypothetical protein